MTVSNHEERQHSGEDTPLPVSIWPPSKVTTTFLRLSPDSPNDGMNEGQNYHHVCSPLVIQVKCSKRNTSDPSEWVVTDSKEIDDWE